MADLIPAIFKVKQGSITNLPVLQSGEFGYATDQYRLFIGNEVSEIGTGDGSNVLFNVDHDLDEITNPGRIFRFFILPDGIENNMDNYIVQTLGVDYNIDTTNDYSIIFTTPPALGDKVLFSYNSEIMLSQPPEGVNNNIPRTATLTNSMTSTNFSNITINTTRFSDVEIRYTISNTLGDRRKGTLKISLDGDSAPIIDDSYISNAHGTALGYVFGGVVSSGIFTMNYYTSITEPEPTNMISWIEENFPKSGA